MLDEQSSHAIDVIGDQPEAVDIRDVMSRCESLPAEIKSAGIAHIGERVIDKKELARLTDIKPISQDNTDLIARLKVRRNALSPYLGSLLTCVFIRLPGVHYTIEIDPISQSVVHWEWQEV